jgi:anti-sigma factor RsiW
LERILHLGGYGCGDTERLLFDFIEEELPAEVREKLEQHLSGCRSCMEYVASYRRTIEATHDHALPAIEMPLELQHRLKEFIAQNPQLR